MLNLKTSHRLIIFITLSLLLQIILIVLKTRNLTKNTTVTKAQETNCPYPNGIAPIGSNIAANNNPDNYAQLRQLYDAQNPLNTGIQKCYIPVTVVYDLFFLKGGFDGIQQNLEAMKKNGLYPIIRIASYTSEDTWIKLYPPTDAKIMGEHLGNALINVQFPKPPIIAYLNEVNLKKEWGGDVNPEEFADSILAFSQGLESAKTNNYQLFFPALSYGITTDNDSRGISPSTFIKQYSDYIDANSKKFEGFEVNGVALNIYGSSYDDIAQQYTSQKNAFPEGNQKGAVITELGPVRNGTAVSNCGSDTEGWQSASTDIIKGIINNQLSLATMGCFGAVTYPAIVHYDGTNPQLINPANTKGQIENSSTTKTTTNNNQQQNQTRDAGITINLNPQNPEKGKQFDVIIQSSTAFQYVYMKIFKATDGKKGQVVFSPVTNRDDIPKTTAGNPNQWVYTVDKPLQEDGEYLVQFYEKCRDATGNNCTEITNGSRTFSIGTGKTNEVQQAQVKTQTTNTPQSVKPPTIRIPTPGKITLDLSTIYPINPNNLEYCQKPQTSNGDCINPHDQQIDNNTNTVTMSFPSGSQLIFCGSIDQDKRNLVNGSDRSCVIFYQKI